MGEVTALLDASARGDLGARDRVYSMLYADLKGLAAKVARSAGPQYTLDTTGLVHESFLRLAGVGCKDRGHFMSLAARAMRQILCDHARRRIADKRGGGRGSEPLDEQVEPVPDRGPMGDLESLIAVDQLLDQFASEDERAAKIVEYRLFAGLTAEETAEVLGVSVRTVHLDMDRARTWLVPRLNA